jgi:hypothetical protein
MNAATDAVMPPYLWAITGRTRGKGPMRFYRYSLPIAAAAALSFGLLAASQAQAFTFENKEAGSGGTSYTEKELSSSRYGSGKSNTLQQNGFSIELKQYGSSSTNGPSDDRNINDLAPRYNNNQGGSWFR